MDPWKHGHDAAKIREHVQQQYIDPARTDGKKLRVEVRVGDVQSALRIGGPADIVSALITEKFMRQARTTRTVFHDGFGENRIMTFTLADGDQT